MAKNDEGFVFEKVQLHRLDTETPETDAVKPK
jgi:hypothetical protein